MSDRYELLQGVGVRNITTYNDKVDDGDKLPYIVVVIDELADLMMTASKEVEEALCRLAQMGRATGIHLVVATQRPSVDVITGLIKANFPSRISFAVASSMDSRTVLDTGGAELLLGKGDMLYQAVDMSRPLRVQGCFISDEEVTAVTDHWHNSEYEATDVVTEGDRWSDVEDEDVRVAIELLKNSLLDGYSSFYKIELSNVLGYSAKKADSVTEELVDLGVIEHDDGDKYRINVDLFDLNEIRRDEHNSILEGSIGFMKQWVDRWAEMAPDEIDSLNELDISELIGDPIHSVRDEIAKELIDIGLIVPVGENLYRFDRAAFVKSDRVKKILAREVA